MSTTFNQVHLPGHTIDAVRTIVSLPLLHPHAFQQGILKEHSMTGCLLFGPPGTGKTLVVRALAKEAGCRMLAVSPSDVMDMVAIPNLLHDERPSYFCDSMLERERSWLEQSLLWLESYLLVSFSWMKSTRCSVPECQRGRVEVPSLTEVLSPNSCKKWMASSLQRITWLSSVQLIDRLILTTLFFAVYLAAYLWTFRAKRNVLVSISVCFPSIIFEPTITQKF